MFKVDNTGASISGTINVEKGRFGPRKSDTTDIFDILDSSDKNRYVFINDNYYVWRMIKRTERIRLLGQDIKGHDLTK